MSNTSKLLLTLAAALALAGFAAWRLTRPAERLDPRASLSVAASLRAGEDAGYARALEPRELVFPEDHGPHPDFRTEWWYFTGNLETPEGRRFGFQLTFFRNALAPDLPERESAWATRQAWLAHFALTDVAGERFSSFERWSRGALGLAGAEVDPFRVGVRDWRAKAIGEEGAFPLRLAAEADGLALELTLQAGKPPVLQGERGLSRKGPEPGNASYYYSLTRLPAAGTVRLDGEAFAVSGLAWMDREWSTSSLGEGQVGWDWFALQLDDGSELMLYRLRRADGTADPLSSGAFVAPGGDSRTLSAGRFVLEDLERWRSPKSGALYPAAWRIRVPSEGLDLRVAPARPDQELDVSFRYWEGAVEVSGSRRGKPVRGRGYAELTGYAENVRR
jgi:predicted secreted hydrolase